MNVSGVPRGRDLGPASGNPNAVLHPLRLGLYRPELHQSEHQRGVPEGLFRRSSHKSNLVQLRLRAKKQGLSS